MQNLVTVVAVEREPHFIQTGKKKINKVRVGADSTLKSIYIKKGKHNARKLARVFLFYV